uniref:Secreted protein n=1 Tax=Romanomermis culicivorax TaxID=13658 RepID=A0A915HXX2_ROMCU
MAHVTLFSVLGKVSATGAISAYCWRRWSERKTAMINTHNQSKNLVKISNGSSSYVLSNNVLQMGWHMNRVHCFMRFRVFKTSCSPQSSVAAVPNFLTMSWCVSYQQRILQHWFVFPKLTIYSHEELFCNHIRTFDDLSRVNFTLFCCLSFQSCEEPW